MLLLLFAYSFLLICNKSKWMMITKSNNDAVKLFLGQRVATKWPRGGGKLIVTLKKFNCESFNCNRSHPDQWRHCGKPQKMTQLSLKWLSTDFQTPRKSRANWFSWRFQHLFYNAKNGGKEKKLNTESQPSKVIEKLYANLFRLSEIFPWRFFIWLKLENNVDQHTVDFFYNA